MDYGQILMSLLGGLGLFFYGMRQMSDSLQQAASSVITKVINSLTSNKYLAVVVGLVVTMIVQSSSVTTVMVVGFVNAGLMQLTQAIGVILGSNIGTTITGWIISIKVGKYGLLFIAMGIFPTLFAKNPKVQNIGRILFGIGMIFFGLELMSGAFKPLRSDPDFLNLMGHFAGNDYGAYLASVLMGCLLTFIIQSSSAMLGITMAMATSGILNFETAVALVLGENIGTTITALLASVGTSTNAKRAARAHAIFNVFGVIIVLSILPFFITFIEWMIPGLADEIAPDGSKPKIAGHIAAAHTFFNVCATLVFVPFLGVLARVVTAITPMKEGEEKPRLVLVGESADILPATAIIQADKEVEKMVDIMRRMHALVISHLKTNDPKELAKIGHYERITDNIQKEVTLFLVKVMEKSLSSDQSFHCQKLIKIVDELESIADYLERISTYRSRLDAREWSETSALFKEYSDYFSDVWGFYEEGILTFKQDEVTLSDQIQRSEKLRVFADDIRDRHLDRVSKGEYPPLTALTYSDMVVALRKIRAHTLNLVEASVR